MSLVIPEQYNLYRVISIDPGLTNTGIAIFDIDMVTRHVKRIEATTIKVEQISNTTGLDDEYFGDRLIKLYKLKETIYYLMQNLNPQSVACESPFYNRLRPMAYGALLETLTYIHAAIIDYNPSIFFKTIEPLLAKKAIGAGIMKGKVDVRYCIENNALLMSLLDTDIDLLDEHALDAIAIAVAFLKTTGVLL